MGGVTKYEKAFFTSEYSVNHKEDEQLINILKDLVASQIPLLDIGIKVHSARAPPSLTPLQLRFEDCFDKMKTHIEENYGKKVNRVHILYGYYSQSNFIGCRRNCPPPFHFISTNNYHKCNCYKMLFNV